MERTRHELFGRGARLRETQARPLEIPRGFHGRKIWCGKRRLRCGFRKNERGRGGFLSKVRKVEERVVFPGRRHQPCHRSRLRNRELPGFFRIGHRARQGPGIDRSPRRRRKGRNFGGLRIGNRERIRRPDARPRSHRQRKQGRIVRNRFEYRHENRNRFLFFSVRKRHGRFGIVRAGLGGRSVAFVRPRHLLRHDRRCELPFYGNLAIRFLKLEPIRHCRTLHLGLQYRIRMGFRDIVLQGVRGRSMLSGC